MKHQIPRFKNEDEERKFWDTHSPVDYFDVSKSVKGRFTNLKPTTRSISIRLPLGMIETLKTMANEVDVPYQALIKTYLGRQITREQIATSRLSSRRIGRVRRSGRPVGMRIAGKAV
jgi:predicted DNA binding CopG/RHH family protein